MNNILSHINKEFENRVRLGIMSVLMVNEWVAFKRMKELLDVTDGNLASHAAALERKDFIEVKKEFVGKKPRTSYRVTPMGKKAFQAHLNALEAFLRQNR